jgi:hypothetical protein
VASFAAKDNSHLYETSADNVLLKSRRCIRVCTKELFAGGDGTIKLVALESEDFVLGILQVRPMDCRPRLAKTIESCQCFS